MASIARLPPGDLPNLPLSALSSIFGSISIACWIVVFSPQIATNFRRQSTEGLSQFFLVIWLLGDVFNVVGAVLQGVLPTMVVLAVYYTVADIALLMQCWWYGRKDELSWDESGEETGLLEDAESYNENRHQHQQHHRHQPLSSILSHAEHLSPAVPLISEDDTRHEHHHGHHHHYHDAEVSPLSYGTILPPNPSQAGSSPSILRSIFINTSAILLVCSAGIVGWYLSQLYSPPGKGLPYPAEPPKLSFWGQVCGYICALLYLASRIPQIVLNYERKSTDGVAILFFLFACVGNGTYVASIFAYEVPCSRTSTGCGPGEARKEYLHNLLINASWLAGSLGTLILDFVVLGQFFVYGGCDESDSEGGSESLSPTSD